MWLGSDVATAVATAPLGLLAWEPPYATGAAQKRKKKKKKKVLKSPKKWWRDKVIYRMVQIQLTFILYTVHQATEVDYRHVGPYLLTEK